MATIQECVRSLKPFKTPGYLKAMVQYWQPETGPFKDVLSCDYFTVDGELQTSLDLYADEILSNDWIILEEP